MMLLGTATAENKKAVTCPPDCGPFGECVACKETDNCSGERCRCDDNHAGDDCSLQIEYCPEAVNPEGTVTTCLNGGRCVEKEIYEDTSGFGPATVVWRCDCKYATGDAAAFAGTQCEFPSTQSCLVGGAESDYTFCVNGGDCVREIIRGQDHPGCTNCPGFEGRHCQYAAGKAPPEELRAERNDVVQGSDDVKPGFIVLLVLLGCLVLGGLALFVWKRSNKQDRPAVLEVPDDLKLNVSADDMDEVSGESPTQEDEGEHKDEAHPQVV